MSVMKKVCAAMNEQQTEGSPVLPLLSKSWSYQEMCKTVDHKEISRLAEKSTVERWKKEFFATLEELSSQTVERIAE